MATGSTPFYKKSRIPVSTPTMYYASKEVIVTYRFGLEFDAPKKDDLPRPPQWRIYVREGGISLGGNQLVTPSDCMEHDIDREIDNLIDALNHLRREARRKFGAWHKEQDR